MKILLVEDDEPTATALLSALEGDRHVVNIAADGQMGLSLAETYDYDLVVLDVLIPKLDGISICRQLRSQGRQMPILLLTAKDSQTDKILGLDAGADDYVVKPFDLEELRARIRALLRRSSSPFSSLLTWGNLSLDPVANDVTYNNEPIALTPKEFGILELLLRNPHRVFSRSAIIDRLWALEDSPAESAVTTHIKDLRQKLKFGGVTNDLIETVYGLGYRLKPAPASSIPANSTPANSTASAEPPANQSPPEPPPEPSSKTPPKKSTASIDRVLDKFRHTFLEQIETLEQVSATLQTAELTPELREQARQEAHKLSGSLGIFGYPNGSQFARSIEQLLANPEEMDSAAIVHFSEWVTALKQELTERPTPARTPTPEPIPDTGSNPRLEPFHASGSLAQNNAQPSTPQPIVLVIDEDVALTEQLQTIATQHGLSIKTARTPASAHEAMAQYFPNLILLDLAFSGSTEDGLTFLAELTHQHPALPVLVFTERDSLDDRVEVSRLGAKGFLSKSMPVEQIMQTISRMLAIYQTSEPKVLIVDDDEAVLSALSDLLRPWGLHVNTLHDPQQFWETLISTQPDVVVFDLEMPRFSGIDLCQVVRHDPQWGDLPILVVTAHTDAKSIRSVFAAGADDFIAKPVVGPELVTRILSRIERVRSRRELR